MATEKESVQLTIEEAGDGSAVVDLPENLIKDDDFDQNNNVETLPPEKKRRWNY